MSTKLTKLTAKDLRVKQAQIVLDSLDSPETRRAYSRVYRDFLYWHQDQGQPPLNRATIQAYRARLTETKSPSVVNQSLAAIKKLAIEMAANGIIPQADADSISNIPGVRYQTLPAGRHIKAVEISDLLEMCQEDESSRGRRDAAIIAAMRLTGMRRAEVVKLRVTDVDFESGKVAIHSGKGRKDRVSYLTEEALSLVAEWLAVRGKEDGALFCAIHRSGKLSYKPLTSQAIRYILDQRGKQAGTEWFTPHDLRRTLISDLLDGGEDIVVVARIVGHSNVNTTARYDRRPERAKKSAIQGIRLVTGSGD